MPTCPQCSSDKVRRGGMIIWLIYLALIAFAVPATVIYHLNSAIIAGIMIAVIVAAHLIFNQRGCGACGHQWKG
jgi:hypothetical protein